MDAASVLVLREVNKLINRCKGSVKGLGVWSECEPEPNGRIHPQALRALSSRGHRCQKGMGSNILLLKARVPKERTQGIECQKGTVSTEESTIPTAEPEKAPHNSNYDCGSNRSGLTSSGVPHC